MSALQIGQVMIKGQEEEEKEAEEEEEEKASDMESEFKAAARHVIICRDLSARPS